MSNLTDAFTRADTGVGVGLGTSPSGLVWNQTSGQWQINGNRAYTNTASTSNPIATVTSTANVDISVSVSSAGGDALYARVTDANNWHRLRLENNTYTYASGSHQEAYWNNGYYTGIGTYYPSDWSGLSFIGTQGPGEANYALGNHWYDYDSLCVDGTYPNGLYMTQVETYDNGNGFHDVYRKTRYRAGENQTYTAGYYSYYTVTDYTTVYDYRVILEKCIAGVVTVLATYVQSSPTVNLRLVAFDSNYKVYINNSTNATGIITDAFNSAATKHGIGRGVQNNASAIDNFSITTIEASPVPTSLTPTTGTAISTGKPTVGVTLNAPTSGQRFKGQWQFATDAGFTTDLITVTESDIDFRSVTGVTSEILTETTRLTHEGTWYFRACAIDEYGTSSVWTPSNSITVDILPPVVPTSITPVSGTVLTTSTPVLQATLGTAADGQKVKAEWQFATDVGFTVSVISVTEPDSALRYSGLSTYVTPDVSKLHQAAWYFRARTVDQYGQYSAYTTSNTVTVAHAPSATNLSPTGAVNLTFAATTSFSWIFSDMSPVDTPTAYQIIIERNDTNALVLDTGKAVSVISNAALAISATFKDIQLRWKIRLWDNDDVVGSYTPYSLFKVADNPILIITSPTDNSIVSFSRPPVSWTFAGSGGRTQATYRVVYTKVGNTLPTLDTGVVASQALSFLPLVTILNNLDVFVITVTVVDNTGLTTTQSVTITAGYTMPVINFSVDASVYPTLGYIKVTWMNVYDSSFLRWRIYRRLKNDLLWVILGEVTDINVNQYMDWEAHPGLTFEYAVVQIAERFGEEAESAIVGITATAQGGDYWLIDPVDSNNNLKLFLVKSDSYSDMYEMAEYTIVGRGRHVDYGESIGKSGSLTVQLRDSLNSTARDKKMALENLKKKRIPVLLRTPFGDVYNVSLGEIAISRIAGTGTSEFCDITVPYLEIF